ncbi:MAG: electron transport complex subunit RsxC [Granulosicoccus sp.]
MAVAKAIMNWHKRILSAMATRYRHGSITPPHAASGGLALVRNKPGLGNLNTAITELPLPQQLVYPLLDYSKHAVKPWVAVGASVTLGDKLAHGILATANGVVQAIEPRQIIHPSYREALCVVVDVDTSCNEQKQSLPPLEALDTHRLEQAGIFGLGGAGFPTVSKLANANKNGHGIQTLLVNAVECEPLISCDEALIRSNAIDVVHAIVSMIKLSACQRCIVAIEEDKLEAIDALDTAIATIQTDTPIDLVRLTAIYPSGAEKVLVQRITGRAIPSGSRASDDGVLCLNVATIVATWYAQAGYPLISRVVTVGGGMSSNPVNIRVRIGTSVLDVLRMTGNLPASDQARVRAGGPLSGFDLPSLAVPITATTNAISIEATALKNEAVSCIRCSQCSDVCPINLVPQQLFWYAKADDVDGARRFGLADCIECGCCDLVCPSHIELTSTFRHCRAIWREQEYQKCEAELARARYEQRDRRLALREQEAQRIRDEKKSLLSSTSDPIAAALARSRARKKSS